jgi:hypothetical protein
VGGELQMVKTYGLNLKSYLKMIYDCTTELLSNSRYGFQKGPPVFFGGSWLDWDLKIVYVWSNWYSSSKSLRLWLNPQFLTQYGCKILNLDWDKNIICFSVAKISEEIKPIPTYIGAAINDVSGSSKC